MPGFTEFTVQLERKLENSFLFACMPVFSVTQQSFSRYMEKCADCFPTVLLSGKTLLFPEDVHKCGLAFLILLFKLSGSITS